MTTKESNEAREIAELHRLFPLQKRAFGKNPYPSYAERLADLEKIKELVLKYQEDLIEAMSDDFGFRSRGDCGVGDMLIPIQGVNYCMDRLKDWMKPSMRDVSLMYKPAENYVMYQPIGVVGLLGRPGACVPVPRVGSRVGSPLRRHQLQWPGIRCHLSFLTRA